jgi:hypothetical protein
MEKEGMKCMMEGMSEYWSYLSGDQVLAIYGPRDTQVCYSLFMTESTLH